MAATSLRSILDVSPVVGTFLKIPRFEVVDLLALAGLDFIVFDYEHAQMTIGDARDLVRASVGRGLPVVVPVPEPNRGEINPLLEAGATGIQLALGSADATAGLRTLVSYPPLGSRSVWLGQPAANYGAGVTLAEHFERSNRETLAVGQFETSDDANGIDAAIAALVVAFIGPVDLSVDLGTPGDLQSAPMPQATAAIEAAAAKAGTPMGIFAGTADAVAAAPRKGYRCLVADSDLTMLMIGARATHN